MTLPPAAACEGYKRRSQHESTLEKKQLGLSFRVGVEPDQEHHRAEFKMGRTSPFHESDGDYRREGFMERGSPPPPLYRLQDSLPRLPVPTLDETFARYLLSIQPLAAPDEYERTVRAVRELLRPGGLVRCAPYRVGGTCMT